MKRGSHHSVKDEKRTFTCQTCGDEFTPPYRRTQADDPKFCSPACYQSSRKGESARRSPEFAKCHPDRPNYSKEMCRTCYDRDHKAKNYTRYLDASRRNLLKRYGLTLDDYAAIHEAQEGRCAICGADPQLQHLHVDHCHATQDVRGLLCMDCNTGLGKFKDSPQLLQNALTYLQSPPVFPHVQE